MREFLLNSRHPGPRREEGGVTSNGPHATLAGSAGSWGLAGEFREAIFYAQARANRDICSELGVQFSKNPGKSPWALQGTPRQPQRLSRDPQGPPRDPKGAQKGAPRDPMEPQRGPRAAQREPSGHQNQAKAFQSHSKGSQNKPKGQTIYQQTPDQPPARPLCYDNILL